MLGHFGTLYINNLRGLIKENLGVMSDPKLVKYWLILNLNLEKIIKVKNLYDNLFAWRFFLMKTSQLTYSNSKAPNCQNNFTQPTITCSKLTIEALEQDVKYVQS